MLIRQIRVSNFRSLRQVEIPLGKTTVLIGPNNAGKTAILEAIRIALTRRWGQRGTGFTEYDIHLCETRLDPKIGDPVEIEVELQEKTPDEWPQALNDALHDIIQADPLTGQASIIMRVSCAWDEGVGSYVPKWEFLNVDRAPLAGRGGRSVNLQEFFLFLPVFYLEALRDASDEFSAKSQFWGRLLRSVQIPSRLEERSKRLFDLLNRKLLGADPKLGSLATGLSEISRVATSDIPGQADLRVLPLNTWDLLSKAEVIYQSEGGRPWLPLVKQGQGLQSLSVIFLFKAFVEILLSDLYESESSPVLALEEPETHLHPQAARSLWKHIDELPGQKIVTTHSPYFLQYVPFRDIRVVRLGPAGTTVKYLAREYRATIPYIPAIDPIIARHPALIEYDRGLGEIVAKGILNENLFRELSIAYSTTPNKNQVLQDLRKVLTESQAFISDDELEKLETFARRIRGEIFFAHRWLLVEGQSEYHLVYGLARAMNYDLDAHGVSVIDFQNNGNPESFAALARALGYPWLIVVDGDQAGNDYIKRIKSRGFSDKEMSARSFVLPAGYLEQQLVADGLRPELEAVLASLGEKAVSSLSDHDFVAKLCKDKSGYASILAGKCANDPILAAKMPEPFRKAIQLLRGLL